MFGKFRHLIVLGTLLSMLALPVQAEDGAPLSIIPPVAQQAPKSEPATSFAIQVRAAEHETYDRVVFDWPHHVPYKVLREGNRVTVHFSAAGSAVLGVTRHLTRGRNFTASADANGNLSVSFDVGDTTLLKDFYSGNSIVVDIAGPAVKSGPIDNAVAEKEKPATNPVVAADKPVPVPPIAAVPVVPAQQAVAAPPLTSEHAVEPVSNAAPVKPSRDTAKMELGTTPTLVAALDPRIPVRAAVWGRAGYGYIVFDKKLVLTAEALSGGLAPSLVGLQPLTLPTVSGFRFAIPDQTEVQASHEGTTWKLYLNKQRPDVPVTGALVAQPDFALGPRYILPLPEAPEPVRMTDPVVGDDLIVLPLNHMQAFSVPRRMADFRILGASQGLVIKPLIDKLVVRSISDGIEITADAGLHISPSTDTGTAQQSEQKLKSLANGKSLFDFGGWRGKGSESFTEARQRLQQIVVDVPDRERNRARLELARFYFAYGYGAEALALLNYLSKDIPDLAAHSDFLALRGAAEIVANRPDEGLKDLDAASLPNLMEIKLWQAVANAKVSNWVEAEEKFAVSENLLTSYPEPFYSRFSVLAVESALAVGNDHEAADWLNLFETSPHNMDLDPAIDYLHGVLHAKAGQAQAAAQSWKLAAGGRDRLYKVRAEMALIDLGVANLSLSPAQAADRLEALRFAWRGDELEGDILHRLGLFYIKAKNVKAGLAILSQDLQLYPHSPVASKVHDEMAATFHDVFLGDLGKNLSPLDALAIYQQYRDTLVPSGEEGTGVMRSLAEHLAAIDLLDQASGLLEDVARNRLKGEEKGKVVARLAALRLLDHKPQAALDALDLGANDSLSQPLKEERILLRAKALLQLHREDEALDVLKDNASIPAKILHADINISQQHWDEAAKNLLELVGSPPKPGEILSNDQADWLVRCAVAMAMTNDQAGLDHLAIDYGAAMIGTPQNNAFRILVQPEKPGQPRDIAAAQSRISDVDMFQGFLDGYRKSEASGGRANDAQKPGR